ncbi:MAG: YggT family protein [Blastocatellia bacterium]|jgi:YggT family protein|nr:YggT family protein [Blastocatellia bacterium]
MEIIAQLAIFFRYAVVTIITAVIALMILRLIVIYADLNPFSWLALSVRKWSDPLVMPVRSKLLGLGFDPKFAPLITILIAVVVGWLTLKLVSNVLGTIALIVMSIMSGNIVALMGSILFGALALMSLFIIARIIFSWGASYHNSIMRFLFRVTEPLLGPFRRLIPTVGMFDISPVVVLLLLQLLQEAVLGTMVHLPANFG